MGTDFYYLSTGSNIDTFKYDKLFSASKKSQNILNREYPTTASTFKGDLITKHEMGFFKPCKNSIIILDGDNKQFTFDKTKLAPNSLYFFPDPNVFVPEYVFEHEMQEFLASALINSASVFIDHKVDSQLYTDSKAMKFRISPELNIIILTFI
jgi:hypothetical protein